jgi:hypothetical protein
MHVYHDPHQEELSTVPIIKCTSAFKLLRLGSKCMCSHGSLLNAIHHATVQSGVRKIYVSPVFTCTYVPLAVMTYGVTLLKTCTRL